jgi:hypothetical protein
MQNALLRSQVKVLKAQATRELGTVKDMHKDLFRQKLDQIYHKRKQDAETALSFVAKIAKRGGSSGGSSGGNVSQDRANSGSMSPDMKEPSNVLSQRVLTQEIVMIH